jgi:hypothetical protein
MEGPVGHHRRHNREAPGPGGCPYLRGRLVLDLCPAGPLPGRRGGRVRAAVPAAIDLAQGDQRGCCRADRRPAQGTGRAGPGCRPHTIAWHLEHHYQIRVSATVSRYLTQPGPGQAARVLLHPFAAELPKECWQSDFTHWQLAGRQQTAFEVVDLGAGGCADGCSQGNAAGAVHRLVAARGLADGGSSGAALVSPD